MSIVARIRNVFHRNGKYKASPEERERQRKLDELKDETVRLDRDTQKALIDIREAWATVKVNGNGG